MPKKQWIYLAAAAGVLGVEILIALFVHDNFIRPYIGDVLAAIFVYCAARVFLKKPPKLLALYVFLFAVLVEAIQLCDIVRILGLSENGIVATIAGGTFDFLDIALYAIGAVVMYGIQAMEFYKTVNSAIDI